MSISAHIAPPTASYAPTLTPSRPQSGSRGTTDRLLFPDKHLGVDPNQGNVPLRWMKLFLTVLGVPEVSHSDSQNGSCHIKGLENDLGRSSSV